MHFILLESKAEGKKEPSAITENGTVASEKAEDITASVNGSNGLTTAQDSNQPKGITEEAKKDANEENNSKKRYVLKCK